jgi:Trypsin-like peptidase domain
MGRKILILASIALLSATASFGANEGTAPSTDFGRTFSPNRSLTKNAPVASIQETWPGVTVRYYRLRVRVVNPSGAPWTLTFKSPRQQILSAFDSRQKDCETAEGCWTRRLGGASVQVEFGASDSNMSARVVAGLFMPDEATNTFYSPIASSPFEFLSELGSDEDERALKIRKSAERLGMLVTSVTQNTTSLSWCCSGVRLTKELFLTNWHCGALEGAPDSEYWAQGGKSQACKNAIVDMSWDEDGISRELSCRDVPYVSKAYDAAIMRLGTLPDGDELTEPFNRLPISTALPQAGTELFIVQHDACKPKRVARSCNVKRPDMPPWTAGVLPAAKTEFSYNCSTEGGSSGSPVFEEASGALLGLHHLGYDADNASALKENVGVKIKNILDDIKYEKPALHQEIMGQ